MTVIMCGVQIRARFVWLKQTVESRNKQCTDILNISSAGILRASEDFLVKHVPIHIPYFCV